MAKVTVLNCWGAEVYPHPVPVISFNEWNGLNPGERHTYPLGDHHKAIQRIYCDDVDVEVDATYRLFDYTDAVKIIRFLDQYPGEDILTHCAAGVSRSPACAKFMIDYLGYERDFAVNYTVGAFDQHNTLVYYTLKRAILDHVPIQQRLRLANREEN